MENTPEEKRPVGSLRLKRGLALAVGISVAALVLISFLTMDRDILDTLTDLSWPWLLLALVVSLTRWLWLALRIRILAAPGGVRIRFVDLVKVVYSGHFTNSVIPLKVGGIAVESWCLHVYGMDAGEALAVITFGAFISTGLLFLFLPVAVVVAVSKIHLSLTLQGILYVALSVFMLFLVLVFYYMKNPDRTIMDWFLRWFPRLSRRPRVNRAVSRVAGETSRFSAFLREIVKLGWKAILLAALCSLLYWASSMLVMPIVLVALGFHGYFWQAAVASLVIYLLMPFVPVPGGSGVGELGFYSIFSSFLPTDLAGLLTLIWRFFDFYLGLLVGGAAFLLVLRDVRRKNATSPDPAGLSGPREPASTR